MDCELHKGIGLDAQIAMDRARHSVTLVGGYLVTDESSFDVPIQCPF